MNRRYATSRAFKEALEQRIRVAARVAGSDVNRLRQRVLFDRFLARIVQNFGDAVVLKGGMALELRLKQARMTKDIDLRVMGRPSNILTRLQAATRLNLGDHLRFEVRPDPRHPTIEAEGMHYEGVRFRVRALLADKVYGGPFGVDIAFAEPMIGEPERTQSSAMMAFAGIEPVTLQLYPLEGHIAEKLHAYTLPRLRPNSRVKDLPDIALLALVRSLDAGRLLRAIRGTFKHRGTHPVPTCFADPATSWEPVYERMARRDNLPWPTIDVLMTAIRAFVDPVLAGHEGSWDPQEWAWVCKVDVK